MTTPDLPATVAAAYERLALYALRRAIAESDAALAERMTAAYQMDPLKGVPHD